jgi:DNA-binding LytR/AlgR family response regulator
MYQIAICDDDGTDAGLLLESIRRYEQKRGIECFVSVFSSGTDLLEQFKQQRPNYDLLFLDVMMPGVDGIHTGIEIRNTGSRIPILYLSSSRDFAVESYEVEASGYLVKPLEDARIFACLDKYLHSPAEQYLAVKINGAFHYYPYREIRYLESRGHTVHIHLHNSTAHWVGKLSELEDKLKDPRFLRCHQSYLINMDEVFRVEEQFVMDGGERVPIRVRERRKITEQYYRYFVGQNLA